MNGDGSGPRPWLAALLALLVTGLGHAYLRRWGRAIGWFLLTFAAVVAFVPDSAVETALAGPTADPFTLAPPVAVVLASAVDAYLLARRARDARARDTPHRGNTCPNCGHDIDPELDLDFCPWCSEELAPSGASTAEEGR